MKLHGRTFLSILICGFMSGCAAGYSTKTSYLMYDQLASESSDRVVPPGYNLQYFYYLGRHGNRFWSDKIGGKINATLQILRKKGFDDVDRFQEAFRKLNIDTSSSLNPAGIYFLYNIGKRYGHRIDLLGGAVEAKTLFASTSKPRAFQSMASFAVGFTNGGWMPGQQIWGQEYTKFLRFFDDCPAYDRSVELAKIILKQHLEHPLFTGWAQKISRRILRNSDEIIRIEDILKLYDICSFCISFYPEDESKCGCDIFRPEELELLEFIKDMDMYYLKGDAFAINMQMSVKHVDYLVDKVSETAGSCRNSPQTPIVDAFFAHAETLIPVEGMFGLFDAFNTTESDLPLTPDNYSHLKGKKRYFRGEKFAPFAGNLAFFVVCPEDHRNNQEPLVFAYLNERNVPLPCCVENPKLLKGFHACTVDHFRSCFKPKFTFNEACDAKSSVIPAA